MNSRFRIEVKLKVRGPFLTSTGTDTSRGIDRVFARNLEDKHVIHGSHIKGKLREALSELAFGNQLPGFDLIHQFGRENADGHYLPERGNLLFGDFALLDDAEGENTATRTSINKMTGTALEHALQTAEIISKPGASSRWQGEISFFAKDINSAKRLRDALKLGFQWMTNLGAVKGSGYGRMEAVELSEPNQYSHVPVVKTHIKSETITLSLDFQSEFFVGSLARGSNYKESEQVIPGAALKGAFARHLNAICGGADLTAPINPQNGEVVKNFPDLCKWFGLIRFAHAFPSKDHKRPVALPFSTVKGAKDGQLYYLSFISEPRLMPDRKAPNYQVDWKDDDFGQPMQECGWASCERINKTRTAIRDETRTAEENKLYTFQYISPLDRQGQKINWIARIDLPHELHEREAERQRLQADLRDALNSGWCLLGKRDALFQLSMQDGAPELPQKRHQLAQSGAQLAVVVLQTDALLFKGSTYADDPGYSLHEIYSRYWREVTQATWSLSRFYARQKMAGGYLGRRYPLESFYYPYILTEAGSVFILERQSNSQGSEILTKLEKHGLPLPDEIVQNISDKKNIWQTCPYVPENGYGEICVNLEWHWQKSQKLQNI